MAYCKYHPLQGATYHCPSCEQNTCDTCVDDSDVRMGLRCILCDKELDSLGSGHTVEPFWRRLQESFRYPLKPNALTMIVGVSILTTALSMFAMVFGLFIILIYLALTGAMMKYCFCCLENTANGDMDAPDISEAYEGGIGLLFQLIGVMILLAIMIFGVARLSETLAGLLAVIVMVGLPAIIIRLAQTQSIFEAANPLGFLQLITAIGLPYGLLIGFIMIMMGSMGVISEIIGYDSIISSALQSIVGNYYMVVVFHIMGYMLFQYQNRLGFSARLQGDEEEFSRSSEDVLSAKIDIHLKEGNYDEVVNLFYTAFNKFPGSESFYHNYYEFLYRSKNAKLMGEFADRYLQFLVKQSKFDKVNTVFKQIQQIKPGFMPATPDLRLLVAKSCRSKGDSATAIKLINGMHKTFPDFEQLVEAYEFLSDCLDDLPNMKEKAAKCRALAAALAKKRKGKTVKTPVAEAKEYKPREEPSAEDPLEVEVTEDKPKDLPPIDFKLGE